MTSSADHDRSGSAPCRMDWMFERALYWVTAWGVGQRLRQLGARHPTGEEVALAGVAEEQAWAYHDTVQAKRCRWPHGRVGFGPAMVRVTGLQARRTTVGSRR